MSHTSPQIDAVIFDMDGVLIDTEMMYRQAMMAACAELGYEMTAKIHEAQIGVPHDASDTIMYATYGDKFPLDEYNARVGQMMGELTSKDIPVKSGAFELLECLRANDVPVAVATSTASPTAPNRLRQTGLLPFFQTVITRNDVSKGKPHPEPYLTAAASLGIAPANCLALEDSHNGVRSAHGAGMITVMVPDLLSSTPEIEALCHAVLPSLAQVRTTYF